MDEIFIVREYFTVIAAEDPKLDIEAFYYRVNSSISRNGLSKTCEVYNLNESIISKMIINSK